ncbi:MAG: alcohol dehydrogenase catalytic domain-containing protein [Cyanobacteria bacterium TGS_CYA1]|nr:alcohol dehydrogenase catalytic domain-containing protein [Cyanobacteria bacterium TGS_CYA1]
MKALRFINGKLRIEEVPEPAAAQDVAVIKIERAGVCNTDLEILKGYHHFEGTIGHEFVGTVSDAQDKSLIGKRVVADINQACTKCDICKNGGMHHCPNRTVIGIVNKDGAFAEYLAARVSSLVEVPKDISLDKIVFAEPVAAALEIQEQLNLNTDNAICVIGDGKLGLLIAMTLDKSGYEVHLVGRHPERIERLANFRGTYQFSAPEKSYAVVVEATGNPQGFQTAMNLVRPRGHLVLNSTYAAPFEFNPSMLVVNEINVIGSRCGPMDKAVAQIASGKIDPSTLIDAQMPLEKGVEALAHAQEKGVLKVLIEFPG